MTHAGTGVGAWPSSDGVPLLPFGANYVGWISGAAVVRCHRGALGVQIVCSLPQRTRLAERGQYGDQFGALNAMFSGLAFHEEMDFARDTISTLETKALARRNCGRMSSPFAASRSQRASTSRKSHLSKRGGEAPKSKTGARRTVRQAGLIGRMRI